MTDQYQAQLGALEKARSATMRALLTAKEVQAGRPRVPNDGPGRHLSIAITELETAEWRLKEALNGSYPHEVEPANPYKGRPTEVPGGAGDE